MQTKRKSKSLALLLSLAMVFTMMPMLGQTAYAADDATTPVEVSGGQHLDVGNVTVNGQHHAVSVWGSNGQAASANVSGNIKLTEGAEGFTSDGLIVSGGEMTGESASVDVAGQIQVLATRFAVCGIHATNRYPENVVKVNVKGGLTAQSNENAAGGIHVEDSDVTLGGALLAEGSRYAYGVNVQSWERPSKVTINGALGVKAQSGRAEGALLSASYAGAELSFSVGSITANYTGAAVPGDMGWRDLAQGLIVDDGWGRVKADIRGDIQVSAKGLSSAIAVGTGYGAVEETFDERGKQSIIVRGNVKSDDKGIYFTASPSSAPTDTDIVVEKEIQAANVGVSISQGYGGFPTSDGPSVETSSPHSLQLTAWKIQPNANGNVAEYETSPHAPWHVTEETPSPVAREFEEQINYIIKAEQPRGGGSITVLDAQGKALQKQSGHSVAREGDKIIVRAGKGYRLKAVYNGTEKKVALPKDKNGDFYLEVPKGGGVYLTATVEKETSVNPTPSKPASTKVSGTAIAKMSAKGKRSLCIEWDKIKGVDGYDIFFAICNHHGKAIYCKKAKTIKGNKTFSWTKKNLKKGTPYKAIVKAYVVKNGKKTYVRSSPMVHAYTGGGTKKYTNVKTLDLSKTSFSLQKGKSAKIKNTRIIKLKEGKKLMPKGHAPKLRYISSNKKVATVSKSGKIKAKGAGSCTIYVIAHNGVSKKVKVTVK